MPRKASAKKAQNPPKNDKEATTKSENEDKKKTHGAPTVQQIISDQLTHLSLQHWASGQESKFNAKIIEEIYETELKARSFDLQKIMLLEVSHYLENYLWKHFDPKKVSFAHLMSIIIMVNEKFRENVQAWECFHNNEDLFRSLFVKLLDMHYEHQLTWEEKTIYITFWINCFQSLEDTMVRKECMSLVSLQLWNCLSPERLEAELKSAPKLAKLWETQKEKQKNQKDKKSQHERKFMSDLMLEFEKAVDSIDENNPNEDQIRYCERFVELMLDLISQLPTRRLFHVVLRDHHLVIRCQMSKLAEIPLGRLFNQQVEMLRFYEDFEVNNFTGSPLSEDDLYFLQSEKIQNLQQIVFHNFQDTLKDLAFTNSSIIENRSKFVKHLELLDDKQLREFASHIALLPKEDNPPRKFITEIILSHFERRYSRIQAILDTPVYPTEELLWDDNIIPTDEYNGEHCLALPKLNLQFLTFHDYLLRNYDLYRLESCYELRQDLEDAIRRVNAKKEIGSAKTKFMGWSRMAVPIFDFSVTQVGTAKLGEEKPSQVMAEIQYSISQFGNHMRDEWDTLKYHDTLFLVSLSPILFEDEKSNPDASFLEQYGVKAIRGCEVKELLDEEGNQIRDFETEESTRAGTKRTLRVFLDPAQYHADMNEREFDVYGSFNLLVRRKPKENNFKAVLDTIRNLMEAKADLPPWLNDIFLGYGDPSNVRKSDKGVTIDFIDTFLSADHVTSSFPDKKVNFVNANGKSITASKQKQLKGPFKITFPENEKDALVASSYQYEQVVSAAHGPRKSNKIPFTPTQISAIRNSMSEGLTMVVGPPGTGKTDVAVQVISNWYHNFPNQRTLLVTHSNQALNQLFEKIIELDIDERHVLRLGHGQELLETEKDFSRFGRVNYMLERRLVLLAQVDALAKSLYVKEDVAYTCETADHFYYSHILAKWEEFHGSAEQSKKSEYVAKNFPFTNYLTSLEPSKALFPQENSFEDQITLATQLFKGIQSIFTELSECHAFELLRSPTERANYLVTRQAKIVAMTCTHAALKRQDLVQLGFKYDNILMEESAQILEIETLIPMLLQAHGPHEQSRLKRVVLIGDHHQLPPVVKNLAFSKFSHMDQSLFARFVRLGVPTVDLDSQGRARPSIAELYNWRYKDLKNLPITENEEFKKANAGFLHEFQLIDVEDFDGVGESQPTAYYYQNLGEAEYLVAVYSYMRLLGYPADKITILTTYNGQKNLIRDVVQARCANNPLLGRPKKITTVDRYQGQQNDYILLSLVRTKAVGHLRDIRRLVVAMSRARLGLYVFCRKNLFENCYELTPTFSIFRKLPSKLQIVENEHYPTSRKEGANVSSITVDNLIQMGTIVSSMLQTTIQSKPQQKTAIDKMETEESQPSQSSMEVEEQKEESEHESDSEQEEAPSKSKAKKKSPSKTKTKAKGKSKRKAEDKEEEEQTPKKKEKIEAPKHEEKKEEKKDEEEQEEESDHEEAATPTKSKTKSKRKSPSKTKSKSTSKVSRSKKKAEKQEAEESEDEEEETPKKKEAPHEDKDEEDHEDDEEEEEKPKKGRQKKSTKKASRGRKKT